MNYYNHHIGDFRSGTIHMSKLMRWLYRDLLEAYYDKEAPLPIDMDRICDMVGAFDDAERTAVAQVLRLKFELREDGYHHARCDEAIVKYQESIAEEQAKSENEAERQRRHRARRAEIFRRLREEFDEVPAYDTKMSELTKLLETLERQRDMAGTFTGNTDDIHSTSQPVTRDIQGHPTDATAITNNQEPITNNQEPEKVNFLSEQSPDAEIESENSVDNLPKKPQRLHSTEEDRECAQWIFDLVLKINPAAKPPSINAWGNDIRLMREIDERSHRQICELFKWVVNDDFWCTNVMCPGKLREKWDMLVLKRGKVRTAASPAGGAYEGTMAAAERAKEMIFGKDVNHATE